MNYLIEIFETLLSLKTNIAEQKIYFEDKNKIVFKRLQAKETKLNYCLSLLETYLNNNLKENEVYKKLIDEKNININKLELICILFGIDDFQEYIKNYNFEELLELVKENRENKIVRIPIQHFDKKPRYLFVKNKEGKLIFAGKK